MKVLVTGGAGYMGSTLVPLLLHEGHGVRVLDNLTHGDAGLRSVLHHPRLELHVGDIRNSADVKHSLAGCDLVIHLAAIVGLPACEAEPELAQSVNVDGSRVLAKEVGKSRPILLSSTTSNYGALADGVCREDVQVNPISVYGRTKTLSEQCLLQDCRTVAFRFATAFGVSPRMRTDLLIHNFVFKAVRERKLVVYEGHYLRTFLHIRDIARSFLFAMQRGEAMIGQIYNVGSESLNCTKIDLAERIRRKTKCEVEYAEVEKDPDQRNYFVSYEKITALGFQATIGLDEGIDELIQAAALEVS